ncbi:MAG: hypothetical protein ACI9MC_002543, partial [Kiritimatiellia bacterium]
MRNPLLSFLGLSALVLSPITAYAGMTQVEQITGRYVLSADGGGSHTSSTYKMTINKPSASAKVHKVYATVAGIPGRTPSATVMTVNKINLNLGTLSRAGSSSMYARHGDVTSKLSTWLDGLGKGAHTFDVSEAGSAGYMDGTGLVVIWNDPTADVSTVTLTLGADDIATGATVNIGTSSINKSAPGFGIKSGVG